MPQYVVLAYDGTDEGAIERRLGVRDRHFAYTKPFMETGSIRVGGAILDHDGAMIGSVVIAEFPDRVAFDTWLAAEPYVVHGIWERIDIQPFRLAILDGKTVT